MDARTSEQVLRREAIRRHLQGERRGDICRDLNRSTAWFDKWWGEYQSHPHTDFADHSRAPPTSPHQMPSAIEQAVSRIRRTLVAGQTTETRYGLIGHRAIGGEPERLGLRPVPSLATIQRLLGRHELTQQRGVAAETA